jgi:hypothetical protein
MVDSVFESLMRLDEALGLPEAPVTDRDLIRINYRPTVLVGLGGSGANVVRKCKRRLYRYFPPERRNVFQFIVIDTDAQRTQPGDEPLDEHSEFLHLPAFEATDLIDTLHTNERLRSWWPCDSRGEPYRVTYNASGANRKRPLGRLSLFHYLTPLIQPALEQKVRQAVAVQENADIGPQSAKVYVVCSVAGGTGSGMFIDVVYIMRHLFRELVQRRTFATGVLLMPDVFQARADGRTAQLHMQANGYAALRELNHLMKYRSFNEDYGPGYQVTDFAGGNFRPFDVCYLVGSSNRDQALRTDDDVMEMVAVQLTQEILTPLAGANDSIIDNQDMLGNFVGPERHPTAYSSFAASSLVYPRRAIAGWSALKFSPTLIRGVLLEPTEPAAKVDAEVEQFLNRAELGGQGAAQVVAALKRDDTGRSLPIPALNQAAFQGLPREAILPQVQSRERLARTALDEQKRHMARRAGELKQAAREAVSAEVNRLVRDPRRGLTYAEWWLTRLSSRLESVRRDQIDPAQRRHAGVASQTEGRLPAHWQSLDGAVHQSALVRLFRWLPFVGSPEAALSTYLSAVNQILANDLEANARTHAEALYADLLQECGARAQDVRSVAGRLRTAAAQREARVGEERIAQQLASDRYVLAQDVTSAERKEAIYAELAPPVATEEERDRLATDFWEYVAGEAPEWQPAATGDRQREGLENLTFHFLNRRFFEQLRSHTLLEQIRKYAPDRWRDVVSRRDQDAQPFWHFTAAEHEANVQLGLATVHLIGYGEPARANGWENEVQRAVGHPFTAVHTQDTSSLLFTHISHGRPLYTLSAVRGALKRAYDQLISWWGTGEKELPVHIFSWSDQTEPLTSGPESGPNGRAAAGGNGVLGRDEREPATHSSGTPSGGYGPPDDPSHRTRTRTPT